MNDILIMLAMTIVQSMSFTLVARARNSNSLIFHGLASTLSNTIWILMIRHVIMNFDQPILMVVYVIGNVIGSVVMHHFSMKYFEKRFR